MQAPYQSPDPTASHLQTHSGRSEAVDVLPFVFEPLVHWAKKTPQKIAVLTDEVAWTYEDVEERTNQLARYLHSHGVKRGDRVAFVLPRGPQSILILVAILKIGAAYIPLDSESPPARIRECLEDAAPRLLLAFEANLVHIVSGAPSISLERVLDESLTLDESPLDPAEIGVTPECLAYIIFTSGSTGRPKGVPISHRSLSNFVWGDQESCIRVEEHDHVFQGFSPASDGHHEEVWPTFLAGATLVVASSRIIHSGPELHKFLVDHKVSIVSCAPTLLSMVDGDVPSLRRILFGAESLPTAIVDRWWRPGREIINTYGPTEATVGATFGHCTPDKPINIGKPLPNYFCYVLDEHLKIVRAGHEGQLAIAGVGVSNGYIGREDLNVGRFVPNPYATEGGQDSNLYLTGDRVKLDDSGNLVWLGRIDAQVKIRGHRIELSEIESQVLTFAAVKSAVVVTRQSAANDPQLVALIVLNEGTTFSMAAFLNHMRSTLPTYMVPQIVEQVDRLPVLPSGKIDRKACEKLHGLAVRIDRDIVPPRTPTERIILAAWQKLFPDFEISCADDFFTDLGGYSLLASRFISTIRDEHSLTGAAVADLYDNPTIRSFAAHVDETSNVIHDRPNFRHVSLSRYRLAKTLQAFAVLGLFGVQGFLWLGPIILAIHFSDMGFNEASSVAIGLAIRAAMVPLVLGMVVALKWTVVGKFKEGRYPVWGSVFMRWWFFNRLMAIAPVGYLTGTPFAALYMRLLGAKVGRNVLFESMDVDCPDLVSVGDNCSFENSSWLHAGEVSQGELHIHPIKISDGCLVGVRSGITGGAVLEEGVSLRDLTCVSLGSRVPAHEEWCGSPGRRAERRLIPAYDPQKQPSTGRWMFFGTIQFACVLLLTILESVPFVVVGYTLYSSSEGLASYLWEPVYAIALVLFAAIQALLVKWLILGKLRPGKFQFPSGYSLRKWFADRHLELMSAELVPIYDSLFARSWCVALGMKCGPRCEIALPRRMPYDLVDMGEGSFLASEVSIGMPIRRNGEIFLEHTSVGDRVFLGNDAVVPQGTKVPEESLLGVLSVWPDAKDCGAEPGQAWLGSPAFRMPNRQIHNEFDIRQTYFPTKQMYIHRLVHEAFRLVVPSMCLLIMAAVFIETFVAVWNETSLLVATFASPVIYLGVAVLSAIVCKVCKALLVGKYEPTVSPLWSPFVWRAETYSAILHDFGVPVFIQALVGTPFLAWLMRFLGATVGSRTFINTTDWTETDLINIGHDVAINSNAPLQAHLFEDRVMKVGAITIGDRCTVGTYSVILCDSELRSDSHVGHLSLVMKGETIPSNTFWAGSPVQVSEDPVRRQEALVGSNPASLR